MAKQNINIGNQANDRSGDPLRTAFDKINQNFTELYTTASLDIQIPVQTGNVGKYLTTNGSVLSWSTVASGTTDRLTNGANEVVLGADGSLTFPNGDLKIAGNTISNYVADDDLGSGSQLEVSQSKTVITNGVTNSLGGSPSLTSQALFEVSTNGILSSFQVINSLGEGESSLTSEQLTELTTNGFKIGLRVTNDLGDGSEPLVAFNGWTFGTVDQQLALTFPNSALQRDTGTVTCAGNASTVVYTGSAEHQTTIKLLIQVEGNVGAAVDWDTQSCEMIIAKSWRADDVAATVYGIVHTSVAPLATFSAEWNALTSRVDVLCSTPSANSVYVKTFATEITTAD